MFIRPSRKSEKRDRISTKISYQLMAPTLRYQLREFLTFITSVIFVIFFFRFTLLGQIMPTQKPENLLRSTGRWNVIMKAKKSGTPSFCPITRSLLLAKYAWPLIRQFVASTFSGTNSLLTVERRALFIN